MRHCAGNQCEGYFKKRIKQFVFLYQLLPMSIITKSPVDIFTGKIRGFIQKILSLSSFLWSISHTHKEQLPLQLLKLITSMQQFMEETRNIMLSWKNKDKRTARGQVQHSRYSTGWVLNQTPCASWPCYKTSERGDPWHHGVQEGKAGTTVVSTRLKELGSPIKASAIEFCSWEKSSSACLIKAVGQSTLLPLRMLFLLKTRPWQLRLDQLRSKHNFCYYKNVYSMSLVRCKMKWMYSK